jgi:hypothetical protein
VQYGWLRPEPTSSEEILGLIGIVERDLQDARVLQVSEDRRFEAAFNAARTAANVALRACGYRTAVQLGHHLKTIESLELTISAEPSLVNKLRVFSKKRNATSYDSAGTVSEQELEAMVDIAAALRDRVLGWIRANHPQLLKR